MNENPFIKIEKFIEEEFQYYGKPSVFLYGKIKGYIEKNYIPKILLEDRIKELENRCCDCGDLAKICKGCYQSYLENLKIKELQQILGD